MKPNLFNIYINGEQDYNYSVEESKEVRIHSLYYSNSVDWGSDFKEKLIGNIIDTGDELILSEGLCPSKDGKIDYLQLSQLHILFRLIEGSKLFQISEPVTLSSF